MIIIEHFSSHFLTFSFHISHNVVLYKFYLETKIAAIPCGLHNCVNNYSLLSQVVYYDVSIFYHYLPYFIPRNSQLPYIFICLVFYVFVTIFSP